jgi:hypothetical protein
MKIGIVSTFSDSGYEEYAKTFVNSLKKFLDPNISVYLYVDNKKLFKCNENIHCLLLEKTVPDLTAFKLRNKDKKPNSYMEDGVRFSHKSYAIWHAAKNSNVDKLFWLDADTVLKNNITEQYLDNLLPDRYFTSYLGRVGRYTETGFIGFNLKHAYADEFFDEFIDYYNSDRIYYELPAYTDCHVYDATRNKLVNEKKITALDLTPGLGKGNFNHAHKGYMIHNKGENKTSSSKKKTNITLFKKNRLQRQQ